MSGFFGVRRMTTEVEAPQEFIGDYGKRAVAAVAGAAGGEAPEV